MLTKFISKIYNTILVEVMWTLLVFQQKVRIDESNQRRFDRVIGTLVAPREQYVCMYGDVVFVNECLRDTGSIHVCNLYRV